MSVAQSSTVRRPASDTLLNKNFSLWSGLSPRRPYQEERGKVRDNPMAFNLFTYLAHMDESLGYSDDKELISCVFALIVGGQRPEVLGQF